MKKILTILVLLSIFGLSNVLAQVPTNGLVAWYPFTGNAIDSSGTGNNGTVYGATLTADRFGKANHAYYFNGASYIKVANSTSLNPTTAITLCTWYKPTDFTSADGNTGIIDKGYTSQTPPYYQYRFGTPGHYGSITNGTLFSSGCIVNGTFTGFNSPSNTYTAGNWYFLAFTYDGTSMAFYINNVLIQTSSITGSINSFNTPLYIGRTSIDAVGFITGTIDDVRIYDHALTQQEILAIYQEGIPKPTSTSKNACVGGTIPSLTATGTSIKWYSDSALTTLVYQGATFNTGQTAVGKYKYYVTQTVANIEGPATIDTLTINDYPAVPTTPTGTNVICPSGNSYYTTTLSTNTSAYVWSMSPVSAGTISGTNTIGTVTWNNTFHGNAYIKVKAQNISCQSIYSDSMLITALQMPVAGITPVGLTTFCQGSSVVLTANTGDNLFYHWQKNGNNISGATDSTYTASQSGSYTVSVTNINNCTSISSAVNVTVSQFPTATITPNDSITICQGNSATLNANTGAGLTYHWQLNGSNINGAIGLSCLAAQQGNYTVVVTNSSNCSATSAPVTITINPSPATTITTHGNTSFCQGDSVLISANYVSGLTYQWLKNDTIINGITDTLINVSQTGNYSVMATNQFNCAAIDNVTITVNPLPITNAGNDKIICLGDTVTLNATGGSTYTWNNGVTQGIPFVPTANLTYVVNATTTEGCSGTDTLTITVNPVPAIPTISQNGNALMSSSTTGNQWLLNGNIINGATSQIYTATVAGFYQLQVTNSYGCSSMSTIINVTVGIEENGSDNYLHFYPNPAKDELTIETNNSNKELRFEIINLVGQTVYSSYINNKKTKVNTTEFPCGIYFLKLYDDKETIVRKFVKE